MTLSPFHRRVVNASAARAKRRALGGGRKPGRPAKTTWPPCVRCGTAHGHRGKGRTPERYRGEPFGYAEGERLCRRCYGWWKRKEKR